MIHDDGKCLCGRGPRRQRLLMGFDLPVGTGAMRENVMDVFHLFNATQRLGILMNQLQQLLHQLRERHDVTLAEIDQPFVDAIAHGTPTILIE